MWFVSSLVSALTYSFRSVLEKKLLGNLDKYILAFGLRFFALPFFVIVLLMNPQQIIPFSELPLKFWLATIYVSVISTPIEMIFFYKALQLEEVSYIAPLISLAPVFTVFINIFVFKEYPTFFGLIGVMFIISAIYLLNVNQKKEGFWQPFKYLLKNRAAKYALIMMLFYSIGIIIDKIAITGSDVYYYAFWNYLLVSISLFVIMNIRAKKKIVQIKSHYIQLFCLGAIVAVYAIFRFIALEKGNAGYISAVLGSSVFFTILFGLILFKEKRIYIKIVSGIMILIGLVLIKIFG